MDTKWTDEQRRAIVTTDRNLLVSAAAGSGKTEVLAERCAHLVCDAAEPCDADELLVVTFTNAAADEMRRRIGTKLSARAVGSENPRLVRQPLLLAAAQIGTIHGLCGTILRRHFHEVALDPNFRLLDEDEAKLLRRDTADALVERMLDGPAAEETARLLEHYAGGSTSRVVDTILGLHEKLTSLCDPGQWLAERRERLSEAVRLPIKQSAVGKKVMELFDQRLTTLESAAARLLALFRRERITPYAGVTAELAAALASWRLALAERSFDQAADIINNTDVPRLPTLKDAELRDRFKPRLDTLKAGIQAFAKSGLFLFTEQELQAGVGDTLWAIDHLTALAADFAADYDAGKRDTNALDFADLERYALRLLRGDDGRPTPIALDYHRHFKHVLVDEYQDVNELQDTLLAMLSDEAAGNLFCVGDVKQSIYRFRQADPARFIARYRRYQPAASADGDVIDMRANFRSRGPLLEALNGVFEALMTKESAEVLYDDSQRLVPGAKFPDEPGGLSGTPVELHVIEKRPTTATVSDYDADEREAALAAYRINDLLGRGGRPPTLVADRGALRPITPGDIAILLRTVRIKAERYAAVLRQADIPVQADSTTGFFQSTEVRDALCALRLIDNRRSEYELAAYLRSPLCGWSDAEDRLATVRLAYSTARTPWFHQAAERYAAEKNDTLAGALKAAFERLTRWRAIAAERSVADTLSAILQETSYLTWCAGLPDGEQRVANLMDLHERARQFDRFRRPTLSRFLHFLTTLEEQADLGMPSVAAAEHKAVRILSIHKSKGLEFPVVILPDLGKEFNLRDAGDTLLMDETVGLGLRVVDAAREAHYPSLASTIAQHEIRRRALAEELRVLYVATTRAREKLILIGTDAAGAEQAWDDVGRGHRGPMPAGDVLAARTMLDWIGPAAAQTEAVSAGSFLRTAYAADDADALARSVLRPAGGPDRVSILADLAPLPTPPAVPGSVRAAIKRLQWSYAFPEASRLPAVTSVTALSKGGRLAPGGESLSRGGVVKLDQVLRPPRCVTPDRTLSPVDVGALTHTVLQRLDFAGPTDVDGVRAQVATLVERRFVLSDDASQVDAAAIAWFAGTELGRRCRAAGDRLRREFDLVFAEPTPGTTDAGDAVMVRGRIDAMIVDDDGLVLIDYKTDRVTTDTLAARADYYGPQLRTYRDQLQRVTGRRVTAAYLVFTAVRQIIPVD